MGRGAAGCASACVLRIKIGIDVYLFIQNFRIDFCRQIAHQSAVVSMRRRAVILCASIGDPHAESPPPRVATAPLAMAESGACRTPPTELTIRTTTPSTVHLTIRNLRMSAAGLRLGRCSADSRSRSARCHWSLVRRSQNRGFWWIGSISIGKRAIPQTRPTPMAARSTLPLTLRTPAASNCPTQRRDAGFGW